MCPLCGRPLLLASGEILSARYEILSQLGSGGMGVVYRAYDRILDDTVAVKVLLLDPTRSAGLARRFRSEIKLARRVSHRNVCRIYEYGEDGRHVYISMELVDGVDLRQRLRSRPLAPEEAFELAIQLTKGLQAVHDVGIVHRDIKSANVMVDARGFVRLMDFGIAKRWISDGQVAGTVAGKIMGTPEYMSPEQARGHPTDFRSDIYSLAIVVFEMFTGQLPFEGRSQVETLMMQIEQPPPLAGAAARRLPRSVVPILRRALAKNPADRYATARGITESLRLARGGPDLEPRNRPSFFGLAVLPEAAAAPPASPSLPDEETASLLEHLLDEVAGEADRAAGGVDPGVDERVRAFVDDLQYPDPRRRWRAAIGLWEMGAEAGAALGALEAASADPVPIVARAAAEALSRLRGGAPRPAADPITHITGSVDVRVLVEALGNEDIAVREWAAVALRDMGPGAAEAVPALLAVLQDPGSAIRDWAALAMASVCTEVSEVLPALVHALKDPNMFLRAAAATALGALGSRAAPAVSHLREALRDENARVRGRAAVALGRIGQPARDAVPALLKMLEDRDVSAADAAALALEKIIGRPEPTVTVPPLPLPPVPPPPPAGGGGPRTDPVEPVVAAPESAPEPSPAEAVAAARLREFARALANRDAATRWRAAVALGQMGERAAEAVRPLIEALDDEDATVRWEAAKALGSVGAAAREAVPALAAALSDEDEVLRRAAAGALGAIGPEAQVAVPALIRSLRGTDLSEPDPAVESLVLIGRASVPALIEAINEGDPRIRVKAAAALTRVAALA